MNKFGQWADNVLTSWAIAFGVAIAGAFVFSSLVVLMLV